MYSRSVNLKWKEGQPRAMRWNDNNSRVNDNDMLLEYRMQLDNMTADQVNCLSKFTNYYFICKLANTRILNLIKSNLACLIKEILK